MIFLFSYFASFLYAYHSIRSTVLLTSNLFQLAKTILQLSIVYLKNGNVFCKKINCKLSVNLCNIPNVQYNHL